MTSGTSTRDVPTDIVADVDARAVGTRLVAMWPGGSLSIELPPRGTFTIGRGHDVDVVIDHPSVSRVHARLVVGDGFRLEDLGSSNGTRVDGRKLDSQASAAIGPGMLAEVGTVLLCIQPKSLPAARPPSSASVVVSDPAMERVFELVDLVAKSALSVILLGETGVGKEVLAQRVHASSPRAQKPFLKLNCAALVESLLESELFGHEKGAFTGANQTKVGLVEAAHEGTLFLDEVGELPLTTQAKLLRVLENGEVTRVGGLKPRPVDVRFVSATNRDLKELVAENRFRQDVFFRLDGFSFRVPPLRERSGEIVGLAQSFLAAASAETGRSLRLSDATVSALLRHRWPGNVRELRNVVARSALVCRTDTIEPEDLHFDAVGGTAAAGPTLPPEAEAERKRILDALERTVWNQTRAAEVLGISRRTLLKRLDALDIPRPRKREE